MRRFAAGATYAAAPPHRTISSRAAPGESGSSATTAASARRSRAAASAAAISRDDRTRAADVRLGETPDAVVGRAAVLVVSAVRRDTLGAAVDGRVTVGRDRTSTRVLLAVESRGGAKSIIPGPFAGARRGRAFDRDRATSTSVETPASAPSIEAGATLRALARADANRLCSLIPARIASARRRDASDSAMDASTSFREAPRANANAPRGVAGSSATAATDSVNHRGTPADAGLASLEGAGDPRFAAIGFRFSVGFRADAGAIFAGAGKSPERRPCEPGWRESLAAGVLAAPSSSSRRASTPNSATRTFASAAASFARAASAARVATSTRSLCLAAVAAF